MIEEGENNYKTRVVKEKRCKPNKIYECRYDNSAHFFQSIATVSKKKRNYRLAAGILSPHLLLSKASPMDPIHNYHIGAHVGQEYKKKKKKKKKLEFIRFHLALTPHHQKDV